MGKPRRRHGFHEHHAAKERLLLDILNGDHDRQTETQEQTKIINGWIVRLEQDIEARDRLHVLPSEREQHRAQRRLRFKKRRVSL